MFPLTESRPLGPGVRLLRVFAPRIARKQQAGQFVILRVHEQGERIPLTIADADPEHGTITLIVQAVGKTTFLLNSLQAGDCILDVVGPLGKASHIERFGTVVVIGGGVGTAIAMPTARALKRAGNRVIGIIGARNRAYRAAEVAALAEFQADRQRDYEIMLAAGQIGSGAALMPGTGQGKPLPVQERAREEAP